MTDADDTVYMSFEEPPAPAAKKKKRKKKKRTAWDDAPKAEAIPKLPTTRHDMSTDLKRGVSQRDRAAVNLKLNGASYVEICDTLEYESPDDAQRAVVRTLALTHSSDDWETLRLVEGARAERLLAQSIAMATADYLETEDGERIPNRDRLAWHRQAGVDLMNHAIITGAKAPAKVEITPGQEEIDRIVHMLAEKAGHESIIDAEVLEIGELPQNVEEWDGN